MFIKEFVKKPFARNTISKNSEQGNKDEIKYYKKKKKFIYKYVYTYTYGNQNYNYNGRCL